jgi:hypothetical protein
MIEAKPLIAVIGAILIVTNIDTAKKEPKKNDLYEDMVSYEKYLDSCIIAKSAIIGSKAIKKDSTAKVLTKVCSVLKTEVKVLKFENKELRSDLQLLATKAPDTVVKTIVIKEKVGLFGKNKFDTLNN